MSKARVRNLDSLVCDEALVRSALTRGVREALLFHKRMGQPIVVWKDGRVQEIPPHKIVIPRMPPVRARKRRR